MVEEPETGFWAMLYDGSVIIVLYVSRSQPRKHSVLKLI
jgi:hypothetical protein